VDERSAAYVALGMARQLGETVGVVSTSGTAVLNLAPAVAEANNQNLPLLVMTADRPPEPMGVFNNQRIDQGSPFSGNCRAQMQIPPAFDSEEKLEEIMRELARQLHVVRTDPAGPLHLNFLLQEPLYEPFPPAKLKLELPAIPSNRPEWELPSPDARILILAGSGSYTPEVGEVLKRLQGKLQLYTVAENLANLTDEGSPGSSDFLGNDASGSSDFLGNPELLLASLEEGEALDLLPDEVYSFGGQVVSKRLKLLLQDREGISYQEISGDPLPFLRMLEGCSAKERSAKDPDKRNAYAAKWQALNRRMLEKLEARLRALSYGNLQALYQAMKQVPGGWVVHLGNSSTVRYSQLLALRGDLSYYSNRGSSGIDGCLSTAVGAAMVSEQMHLLVLGDLSFVYDSNGLWNRDFPNNLKIVVLNDGEGGIFRLLKGPSDMPFFEDYSLSPHPVDPAALAAAFGREVRVVKKKEALEAGLQMLFGPASALDILEVRTMDSENSRIFKDFIKPEKNA